jgi:VWFA-related protein
MAAFLLLSLSLILAGQAPPGRTVFSSRSELVALHVSVSDRRAGFVSGLPRDAFIVYEDGRPQEISFFENEDSPVTVGFVVDSSGSMQRMRQAVIAAGMAFAHASHPDDEMFTVHFNERVWLGLPAGQPFTSDREELRRALMRSTARGQTALFDALRIGLDHLETGRMGKKVIVLVSDGGDNSSRAKFEEVLDSALRMNAVIYSVAIYDRHIRDANPKVLRELAKATGGEAYFPRGIEQVSQVLEGIARDIRSGYTIGYVPSNSLGKPGYRAIRVSVRSPDRRKLHVRARAGYMAGGQVSSR